MLVFGWFWTEGFGFTNKYPYGSTIEKALKSMHDNVGYPGNLTKIAHTVDIEKNKKLVFYERDNNTLGCELPRKKWNGKWIVLSISGLELPLEAPSYEGEDKSKVCWAPSDMNEFSANIGVIYDENIDKVQVAGKEAILFGKGSDMYIWCFVDMNKPSLDDYVPYRPYKPLYDVKAYDKNNNLEYSYYTEK